MRARRTPKQPGDRNWTARLRRGRSSVLDRITYVVVAIILLCALFGPLIAPSHAFESDIMNSFAPPSAAHWFGTDDQGRDVFWRVVAGTQVSVLSSMAIVAGYALIAVVIATLATVGGRAVDTVLMSACDIGLAIPPMIAALGFAAALGPSLRSGIIAMILAGWTISARLLRVIMRRTMEQPFVNSARAVGASTARLMIRHVLPESLDNLFVKWTADVGTTIVALAALSFIGVGAQPPSAEWGAMIAGSQSYIANAWWAVAAPGLAIVITATAFGLLGDILQVRRDPALRAAPRVRRKEIAR